MTTFWQLKQLSKDEAFLDLFFKSVVARLNYQLDFYCTRLEDCSRAERQAFENLRDHTARLLYVTTQTNASQNLFEAVHNERCGLASLTNNSELREILSHQFISFANDSRELYKNLHHFVVRGGGDRFACAQVIEYVYKRCYIFTNGVVSKHGIDFTPDNVRLSLSVCCGRVIIIEGFQSIENGLSDDKGESTLTLFAHHLKLLRGNILVIALRDDPFSTSNFPSTFVEVSAVDNLQPMDVAIPKLELE